MLILRTIKDTVMTSDSCVALGFFDGLHPGHCAVISAAVNRARETGLAPCVFTFSMDGARPASKQTSHSKLLASHRRNTLLSEMGVTHILCPPFEEFCSMTPEEYVQIILRDALRAKHVFSGEDYHFGRRAAGGVADLRRLAGQYGMETTVVPMVSIDGAPVSSTRIRKLVMEGEMQAVQWLLGRPFSIDFEVVHGRGLGHQMDYPTINQPLPEWFILPRFGVYATAATINGRRYLAVTNVGVKPTFGSDQVLSETCILGYHGDLYGRRVLVEFFEFLRPEQKFADLDALWAQIRIDTAAARSISHKKIRALYSAD